MDFTSGGLVMAHEGGYSEAHVPFCGHAVLEALSQSAIHAEDPLEPEFQASSQTRFNTLEETRLKEIASLHRLVMTPYFGKAGHLWTILPGLTYYHRGHSTRCPLG